MFLFLGDAIYGDFDGKKPFVPSEESLTRDWDLLAGKPGFKELREQVPVLATWDNHDYGKHDGGAEFELKEKSQRLFLDFLGEPADSTRRQTPGVYDSATFGPPGKRLQIILLDTRYFKGPLKPDERSDKDKGPLAGVAKYAPNTNPDVTLLGQMQWRWLGEQLQQPADLRVIVSSTQVIADQKGMDEWGNYPLERQRLIDLIRVADATPTVLLSGNVHFSEISRLGDPACPLVDFTASGMTHTNPLYASVPNPYRVAGPLVEPHFGLLEIDWSTPAVLLSAIEADGTLGFEYGVEFQSQEISGSTNPQRELAGGQQMTVS